MVSRQIKGLNYLVGLSSAFVAVAAFWGLVLIFNLLFNYGISSNRRYGIYSGIVMLALAMDYFRSEETARSGIFARRSAWSLRTAFRQTGTVYFFLLCYFGLSRDAVISRIFLTVYAPVLLSALWYSNLSAPVLLARVLFHGHSPYRVLIMSVGGSVIAAKRWLSERANLGFEVVGMIGGVSVDELESFKILGEQHELIEVIARHRVNLVVHSGLLSDLREMRGLQNLCDSLGVRLVVSFSLVRHHHRPINIWEDNGLHFLSFREEPLECPSNRLLKRGMDILIAFPVVMVILPAIALVVWMLQRLQSPGRFSLRRIGLG